MATDNDIAPEGGTDRLRETTAPVFGLLLEAALAPHVIRDRVALLPDLEREEALDALDHGALKWSWLMLGWATENGLVAPSSDSITIDQEAFLDAVWEVGGFVTLEYSSPLQQQSSAGPRESRLETPTLRPLPTQRLHLVDRHEWQMFPPLADETELTEEELEEVEIEGSLDEGLPLFGEPAKTITEGERVGEVWIRIAPESRGTLIQTASDTLQTLAIITRARAALLRHVLHADVAVDRSRLDSFNHDLTARERLANEIDTTIETLATLTLDDDRRRVTERFFARYGKQRESYIGPLMRGELDHLFPDEHEWATELREDLDLMLSELDCIIVEYRTEHGLRDKLDRWKRRVRERLATVGLSAEAAAFDRIVTDSAKNDAAQVRDLVAILVDELQLHPEHYESAMQLSPAQAAHDRKLFNRYHTSLPETGRSMQLVLSRFNFGGAFQDDDLADFRACQELFSVPDGEFYDQQLERLRRALASAIGDFLMTIWSQTFDLKDNRAMRQVPFEWQDDQPSRYDRAVKTLNAQAHEVELSYREFVRVGRIRTANVTTSPDQDGVVHPAEQAPVLGVITALSIEFAAFKNLMTDPQDRTLEGAGAGLRVTIGTIPASNSGSHRVLLALADVGNNLAAARASRILDRYPNLPLIMLGIAGGVPNPTKPSAHPRLGDVVVSDRAGVVQFDFQKQTSDDVEFRHPPRPPHPVLLEAVRHFEADRISNPDAWASDLDELLERLRTRRPPPETDVLASSDGAASLQHPDDPDRTPGLPRVMFGPIASSNTLLKNADRRDLIRDRFGVLAVEMEASGIADASWLHGTGYLVVRGISDYSDPAKNDAWQRYAAAAAALYLYKLLEATPPLT